MRPIKFRAWNKRFKTMGFGGGDLLLRINSDDFSEPQQFTGLKDKNGVEIYEGDIVKYRTHPMKTSKGIIVWSKNEPALKILDDHIYYSLGSANIIEVIGNIHENPELLTN
jgi:hypothetical protein